MSSGSPQPCGRLASGSSCEAPVDTLRPHGPPTTQLCGSTRRRVTFLVCGPLLPFFRFRYQTRVLQQHRDAPTHSASSALERRGSEFD